VIKIIKTEAEYDAALARIRELVVRGKNRTQEETNELEVLSLLVKTYEDEVYPTDIPDPIEAIVFRMEQQNLQPRDLIPYIGSRSKVSEVLSGKRPLTLPMIRALHDGLKIPLKALIKEPSVLEDNRNEVDWARFPLREMIARGWVDAISTINPIPVLKAFFERGGGPWKTAVLYRRTRHIRSGRSSNPYHLEAWRGRVMNRVAEAPPRVAFEPGSITDEFMRDLAKLSAQPEGPRAAVEFLANRGIALIIEPQLSQTYLDGAAFITPDNYLVIGLTIRFDRVDNFWFALMHELAHLARHLDESSEFYDDLEADELEDPLEKEADEVAREALVPSAMWVKSGARATKTPEAVNRLAQRLGVHPALVAGRIRFETGNYRLLNHMVGHNEVRHHFPEINWEKGLR
jgi:HTH-type transcriptional regulator / antitoxin HigA